MTRTWVRLPARPPASATTSAGCAAADTLFLVGSRKVFEFEADRLRELAEDCPARMAEQPERHCCAEMHVGRGWQSYRRDPRMQLHVEYCREHW